MGTLLRIGWINLRRDRVAQALTFHSADHLFLDLRDRIRRTGRRLYRADPDCRGRRGSLRGQRAADRRTSDEKSLRPRTTSDEPATGPRWTRAAAERLVRAGDVPVAVVIPAGLGEAFTKNGFAGGGPPVQLLSDVSDPIAPQMVLGLLQKVAMTAAPDLLMQGGMRQFEEDAGAMTPQQKAAVDAWLPRLKAGRSPARGATAPATGGGMPIGVEVVDVMRTDNRRGSLISFYAAGIGVMFLLFSTVGGAGGALLDEAESGTLERLLSTNIGMTGVLVGKWILLALVGCLSSPSCSSGDSRVSACRCSPIFPASP